MSTHRYWKANKETSAKILGWLDEWEKTIERAKKFAKRVGASSRSVYTTRSFSTEKVSGVIFADESKVDTKLWKRLKGTSNGWAPKRTSAARELRRELDSFYVDVAGRTMLLIGMAIMDSLSWRTPGIYRVGNTAYLVTPDDVEAKGCRRISDIQFEKAVKSC